MHGGRAGRGLCELQQVPWFSLWQAGENTMVSYTLVQPACFPPGPSGVEKQPQGTWVVTFFSHSRWILSFHWDSSVVSSSWRECGVCVWNSRFNILPVGKILLLPLLLLQRDNYNLVLLRVIENMRMNIIQLILFDFIWLKTALNIDIFAVWNPDLLPVDVLAQVNVCF